MCTTTPSPFLCSYFLSLFRQRYQQPRRCPASHRPATVWEENARKNSEPWSPVHTAEGKYRQCAGETHACRPAALIIPQPGISRSRSMVPTALIHCPFQTILCDALPAEAVMDSVLYCQHVAPKTGSWHTPCWTWRASRMLGAGHSKCKPELWSNKPNCPPAGNSGY